MRHMTTPSTADSKDSGTPVRPVTEPGALGPSATHAVVKGEVSPRLPHERDESSDSGTGAPTEVMQKAAEDVKGGHVDQPRGPDTQKNYSDLTVASRPVPPGR
jgi:hypothetical protein